MPRIRFQDWPPYSPNDLERRENCVLACRLMMNAALTSPVTGGIPQVEGEIVYGMDEQEALAQKVEELAYHSEKWQSAFLYEAVFAREADAILLIGNTRAHRTPWEGECGSCGGRPNCSYFYEKRKHVRGLVDGTDRRTTKLIDGPMCTIYAHNMGYAIGSAMMESVRLYIDARPIMSIGIAARKLGYCPNSELVVAVPVAARQKFEFGEMGSDYHLLNMGNGADYIRRHVSQSGVRPAGGADYRMYDPQKDGNS